MQTHEEIKTQAQTILSELQTSGVSLGVTGKNSLRIKGAAIPEQLATVRLWKSEIIDGLSPKCSNCTLAMQLINDGELWFCSFGCESREANK